MLTAVEMVATARGQVENLTSRAVAEELADGNVVLVDVREPGEREEVGIIAGAVHVPRGVLEFSCRSCEPCAPLRADAGATGDPALREWWPVGARRGRAPGHGLSRRRASRRWHGRVGARRHADRAAVTGLSAARGHLRGEVVVDVDALKLASRSISRWTGAFAASGYFARECHERYEALGLGEPVGEWRDVVVGTPTTFHAARVAALGDVSTELARSVFPQMAPRVIAPAVERVRHGSPRRAWSRRVGTAHWRACDASSGPSRTASRPSAMILRRACDAISVGGRPFAAALLAPGWTGDPLADAWHGAEILREVRGDAHNATWLGRGLTGPQIHILTEHWYGLTGCGFRQVWGWTDAELEPRPTVSSSRPDSPTPTV